MRYRLVRSGTRRRPSATDQPPGSLPQIGFPSCHQLAALELIVHRHLPFRALEDQRGTDDGVGASIAGLAGSIAAASVARRHHHDGRGGLVLEIASSVEHHSLLVTV